MLHLITPLYRYNNIKRLYINLRHQLNDCNFKWHLIEGSNKIGEDDLSIIFSDKDVYYSKIDTVYRWGHEQRNHFIYNSICEDLDWCYFLDDDNMITGDLVNTYLEDGNTPELELMFFSQIAGMTDKIRLYANSLDNFKLGNVDIGSFLIRYKLLKTVHIDYISERNADGSFVETIKRALTSENSVKIYPNKYTRYNTFSHKEII